jgi:hypothetical protein
VRAEAEDEIVASIAQATTMAFEADQQIAVLIGQRAIGAKTW